MIGKPIYKVVINLKLREKKDGKCQQKYNELITDFLHGKLSSEKRKEFEIWLTKSPYNQSYFESIKKIWEFSEPKAEKNSIPSLPCKKSIAASKKSKRITYLKQTKQRNS